MKYGMKNIQGLSIIEVMIGIFIFSLGISAIFMVIVSTLKVNTYNKNYIVASNLAREQIELIRNIRDTNYSKFQKWDTLYPYSPNYAVLFTDTTRFYKLENDLLSAKVIANIGLELSDFKPALESVSDIRELEYRLCLTDDKQYVFCNGSTLLEETNFYRYVEVKKLTDGAGNIIANAFKVRSKVYWNQRGVHDTEISTILSDWERL